MNFPYSGLGKSGVDHKHIRKFMITLIMQRLVQVSCKPVGTSTCQAWPVFSIPIDVVLETL